MIIIIHIPVNLGSVAQEVVIEEFVGGEDLWKNNHQISYLNTIQKVDTYNLLIVE